jgi:hypothetical protein
MDGLRLTIFREYGQQKQSLTRSAVANLPGRASEAPIFKQPFAKSGVKQPYTSSSYGFLPVNYPLSELYFRWSFLRLNLLFTCRSAFLSLGILVALPPCHWTLLQLITEPT